MRYSDAEPEGPQGIFGPLALVDPEIFTIESARSGVLLFAGALSLAASSRASRQRRQLSQAARKKSFVCYPLSYAVVQWTHMCNNFERTPVGDVTRFF